MLGIAFLPRSLLADKIGPTSAVCAACRATKALANSSKFARIAKFGRFGRDGQICRNDGLYYQYLTLSYDQYESDTRHQATKVIYRENFDLQVHVRIPVCDTPYS